MSTRESLLQFLAELQQEDLQRLFLRLVDYSHATIDDLQRMLGRRKTLVRLPSFIFVPELGALESVVKYLREEMGYSYHKIAVLLNRDDRTIWTTYSNASRKYPRRLVGRREFSIPLSILDDRRLGMLEAVVCYLKDELHYRFRAIGKLLGRDERTIWTTHHRARVKLHETR